MFTSKQCTYLTYYHFIPEDYIGSRLITYNMSKLLNSRERTEGGKTQRLQTISARYTYVLNRG